MGRRASLRSNKAWRFTPAVARSACTHPIGDAERGGFEAATKERAFVATQLRDQKPLGAMPIA
jgi:hypothetical protein